MITDWLMVIITSVYVIATILICVFNARSAKAARDQTEQMKLQFLQTNRPIVTVEIVYLKRAFWVLRFTNHGTMTAFNTRINLAKSFIDSLPEENFRQIVEKEVGKIRTIGVHQHYDIFFGGDRFRASSTSKPAVGRVSYRGTTDTLFAEDFRIELSDYATFYSVDSELEDIKKAIQAQTKEITKIKQSIDNINCTTGEAEERTSLAEYLGVASSSEEQ